ncbi:MAG: secondary thiamine-phosphate synthase enzyme YjbQ [Actinomycetota bacterium]
MIVHRDRLSLSTSGEYEIIDITADVEKALISSGVEEGYALIYSPHTTCGVMVNERESGLLVDIQTTMRRLVPEQQDYLHDNFEVRTENMHEDETQNCHAHLRQLISARTSEYIPVAEGSLQLGEWQRVMFVEFDRGREREVLIQVCGI